MGFLSVNGFNSNLEIFCLGPKENYDTYADEVAQK